MRQRLLILTQPIILLNSSYQPISAIVICPRADTPRWIGADKQFVSNVFIQERLNVYGEEQMIILLHLWVF